MLIPSDKKNDREFIKALVSAPAFFPRPAPKVKLIQLDQNITHILDILDAGFDEKYASMSELRYAHPKTMLKGGVIRDAFRKLSEPFEGSCDLGDRYFDIDFVTERTVSDVERILMNAGFDAHISEQLEVNGARVVMCYYFNEALNREIKIDIVCEQDLQNLREYVENQPLDFRCNYLFAENQRGRYILHEPIEGAVEDAQTGLLKSTRPDVFKEADKVMRTVRLLSKGCHLSEEDYPRFVTDARETFLNLNQAEKERCLEDLLTKYAFDPLKALMYQKLPEVLYDFLFHENENEEEKREWQGRLRTWLSFTRPVMHIKAMMAMFESSRVPGKVPRPPFGCPNALGGSSPVAFVSRNRKNSSGRYPSAKNKDEQNVPEKPLFDASDFPPLPSRPGR